MSAFRISITPLASDASPVLKRGCAEANETSIVSFQPAYPYGIAAICGAALDSLAMMGTMKVIMVQHASELESPRQAVALTKAVARVCSRLALSAATLSRAIGVSEAEARQVLVNEWLLSPDSPQGRRGIQLVCAYRSLSTHTGDDDARSAAWMSSHNRGLGGVPLDLLESEVSAARVLAYLESSLEHGSRWAWTAARRG